MTPETDVKRSAREKKYHSVGAVGTAKTVVSQRGGSSLTNRRVVPASVTGVATPALSQKHDSIPHLTTFS